MLCEDDKKFIEKGLNIFIKPDHVLYGKFNILWKFTERAISGRSTFETITQYEAGKDIRQEYDFARKESINGGISVSLEQLSEDFWIPTIFSNYKKNVASEYKNAFEILNPDEINEFLKFSYEDYIPILNVLRCKNENSDSVNLKEELFLNDSSWRKQAKDYSLILLQKLYRSQEIYMGSLALKELDEFEFDSIKAINLLTKNYLNEIN